MGFNPIKTKGMPRLKIFLSLKRIKAMLYTMIISGIIAAVGCLQDETPEQLNFVKPEKVCELPAELMEVSGLTDVDNQTIACVQDEQGIIYFYDLEKCAVKRKVEFAGPGDFEGLTRVGDHYFSLRSDGLLFEVKMGGDKPIVREIETKIPAGDNEGLAFDAKHNRLLIAPKAKYTDKEFGKTYRAIYAYDLGTGKMLDKPVLEVNMADAEKFLLNKQGVELPKKKKSGEVNFQFDISSITLHPDTDQYYILVTSAKLVVVTDDKGRVIDALPLDSKQFPQPEGITFLDNGQLVITTEGVKGMPVLGVFKL
jgi:uncharacterized protein YjiK